MGDEELRRLESQWLATGTTADQVALWHSMRRTGVMSLLAQAEKAEVAPSGAFVLVQDWGVPQAVRDAWRGMDGASRKALEMVAYRIPGSIRFYAVSDSAPFRSGALTDEDLWWLGRFGDYTGQDYWNAREYIGADGQVRSADEIRQHTRSVALESVIHALADEFRGALLECDDVDGILRLTGLDPVLGEDGEVDADDLLDRVVEPARAAWETIARFLDDEEGRDAQVISVPLTAADWTSSGSCDDVRLYVGKHRAVALQIYCSGHG